MHELPIVKTIFKNVIEYANKEHANKVAAVYLEVGVLRDFIPEFLKKYWSYVTKDTIADESKLLIREIPAAAKCKDCGTEYNLDMNNLMGNKCPSCGCDTGELVKGRELIIYSIEIK